jgi:hypothetical protein
MGLVGHAKGGATKTRQKVRARVDPAKVRQVPDGSDGITGVTIERIESLARPGRCDIRKEAQFFAQPIAREGEARPCAIEIVLGNTFEQPVVVSLEDLVLVRANANAQRYER